MRRKLGGTEVQNFIKKSENELDEILYGAATGGFFKITNNETAFASQLSFSYRDSSKIFPRRERAKLSILLLSCETSLHSEWQSEEIIALFYFAQYRGFNH